MVIRHKIIHICAYASAVTFYFLQYFDGSTYSNIGMNTNRATAEYEYLLNLFPTTICLK